MLAVSALLLASCGGGGASTPTTPNPNAPLSILPAAASFYAGIPYTIQVAGGRRPYLLSSSDSTVLAVPGQLNANSFQVIPNNPGVIDPNLPPGSVPQRTANIQVRDQDGNQVTAAISVLQNFLTGYSTSFVSDCVLGGQACAGGETIVFVTPVTNGLLYGNRVIRFEVVRGNYQLVIPESPSNPTRTLANAYTTNTDHTGTAIARLVVASNAPGQLATIRIIDVATGVYTDQVFLISPTPSTGVVSIVPSSVTFTGLTNTRCGTGSADILVFGGNPPYTATSTNGAVAVTPNTSSTTPGRFTVTALNQSICGTFTVVVTDSTGSRAEVTVTTELGTTATPAVVVSPATLSILACGGSGSVSVVGGGGTGLVANSSSPFLGAALSGNTLTVTRLAGQGGVVNNTPTPFTVSVTDGATSSTLTVNAPTNCP